MGKKFVLSQEDGTVAGGNARGDGAVDLQLGIRDNSNQVASGIQSVIINGTRNRTNSTQASVVNGDLNLASGSQSFIGNGSGNTASGERSFIGNGFLNTASSQYSTVSGGQSNTASTGTHATVVGGFTNTASGANSVVGGTSSIASGNEASICFGQGSTASAARSVAIGFQNQSTVRAAVAIGILNIANADSSIALGLRSRTYLLGQLSLASDYFAIQSDAQQSLLTARRLATLTTAATTVLSLDGTGVTNLIIPDGNNRAWNVQVNWVAVVTTITGTATGITVGDVVTSIDLLAFKRIGGVSSASAHTSTATKLMVTTPAAYAACAIAFTAGASQEMELTFTGPTFVGGGSVTMRVVAKVELAEVAF